MSTPKVHRPQGPDGGDKLIIESGGEVDFKAGSIASLPTNLSRVGERTVAVDDNKTLAAADAGIVQVVTEDAKTITLPATVVGLIFTIRNGGADGAVAVTVSPNSADLIQGNGFTAADDKDAINTKATAKQGDEITLIGNGTTGWTLHHVVGTWAREA